MRRRLREFPSDDELATLYARPYDHTQWEEHVDRVQWSIARLHMSIGVGLPSQEVQTVADLSCGDGEILNSLKGHVRTRIYGDIVENERNDFTGPIEDTILCVPPVDLFICTETLEHVNDPDELLRAIRAKTQYLFLTTPHTENGHDNPEHIWEWDRDGIGEMLVAAGFTHNVSGIHRAEYYDYQMWVCR